MDFPNQKSASRIFFSKSIFTVVLALVTIFACEVEEPIPTYTLATTSSPAEGGKITISPQVPNHPQGSQVTLTPEPNENWVFKQWEGDATGNTTPLQITMTANKSITGVFVKRDYPLNIKIEGEGTVEEKIIPNPSGREYPHGTTVELTPKPKEGWEFDSWSGDLTGKESPKRITVDKQKNVTVKFKVSPLTFTKKVLLVPSTKFSPETVGNTLFIVSGAFIYNDGNGGIFAFHPGNPIIVNNSRESSPPASSQILRRVNGEWQHFKEDDKALFWGARNFKIIGDKVVIGDGNEIGPTPRDWKGNILFGKILPGGNIDWKTVNKPDEMGFYHGITMGDLNKDGLLDFGGSPGFPLFDHSPNLMNFFIQEAPGLFKRNDEIFNFAETTRPFFEVPFTLEFADLFGDSRDEIITANYGGNTLPTSKDHEISIYAFSNSTQKFELTFRTNYPNAHTWGLGATSIKVFDVNKDGIKDLAIAREGSNAAGQLTAFEVWLGKNDGTFVYSFSSPTWTEKELQFREFVILDANNDGRDDIILVPFHYGSLFRNNGPCGPGTCEGIKLNHLIWLNKGDGTFEYYNKTPLVVPDITLGYLLPYKENGKLHFYGTTYSGPEPPAFTVNFQHTIYDFKVNLDN